MLQQLPRLNQKLPMKWLITPPPNQATKKPPPAKPTTTTITTVLTAISATQNTSVSTLTPPTATPDKTKRPQPTAVTPEQSVVQSTQSNSDSLAKEMDNMRQHKQTLDDWLKTLENGQNTMSETMNVMAANISTLMQHFPATPPPPSSLTPSLNDFHDFKHEIRSLVNIHFQQMSASTQEMGITIQPMPDHDDTEMLPLELMDDVEIQTSPVEQTNEEDMELDDLHLSSTTHAKEIRKPTASSAHQPDQKRHKGDDPAGGRG